MAKDIVDIVIEKEYIQLTAQERADLAELCANEDEFNQMKDVLTKVGSMEFNDVAPSLDTKSRLDDLFHETYPKTAPVWYMSVLTVVVPSDKPFIRQPLLKVAAIALLFIMAYPLITQEVVVNHKDQLAELETPKQTDEANKGEVITTEEPTSNETIVEELNEQETVAQDVLVGPFTWESTGDTRLSDFEFSSMPVSIIDDELTFVTDGTVATATGAAAPGVNHPDGIFGGIAEIDSRSISAAEMPDVLDLLTSTF